MLKADDWSFLRRLYLQEGKSIRWISREFDISRKTVAKYVREPGAPRYNMAKPRASRSLEPFKSLIDEILEKDKSAPSKQRHTAKRIFDRLVREKGFCGGRSTVRRYIALKRQSETRPSIFVPLLFAPGSRAQVDFGDVYVCLDCPACHLPFNSRADVCANQPIKLQCFVIRLCSSRRLFVMCFPSANTVSFIAAHRMAFEHYGSRPKELVYDNLTIAVRKVLKGRDRELSKPFLQLAGYYGFGYHFCKPGKEGAHEKGGVEEGIGFVRRNWFVPVLHVRDIEELNAYLLQKCDEDMARTVEGQSCSIGEAWDVEKEHMVQLPAVGIDACTVEPASFDDYGMVRYDRNFYSIPDTVTTSKLWVKAYWDYIDITDGSQMIASHHRSYERQQRIFEPAHYFKTLEQRPGAVGFAQPLLAVPWPPGYWELFEELKELKGVSHAGKEFIQLLRLHNQYGAGVTGRAVAEARALEIRSVDAIKSLIIAVERPTLQCAPLDLSDHEHLSDYEVLMTDLTKYQSLTGGQSNDAEHVA